MVMNRTNAFSSSSNSGHINRWRAFLKRRRRMKRDNFSYIALTCALIALLVIIPLFTGQIFFDQARYEEVLNERPLRSGEDFDGSSVHIHDGHHHGEGQINCTERSIFSFPLHLFTRDQRRHGAVVIHVFVITYMFASLGIVCEEYFMPALEVICDVLNLSEDVAGATFMAIGGSAPELFSSLIAVFVTHDDIGVGTIVGSAVFNILFVIGLCGLLAGQVINLTCWPLIRDCSCYIVSIIALFLAVKDGEVSWKDSVTLLALYVSYCILMFFNRPIEQMVSKITPGCCTHKQKDITVEQPIQNGHARGDEMESTRLLDGTDVDCSPVRHQMNFQVTTGVHDPNGGDDEGDGGENNNDKAVRSDPHRDLERNDRRNTDNDNFVDDENETEPGSPFRLPEKGVNRYAQMLAFPIIAVFFISIPDCRRKRWKRCYVLTFICSLLWIGFLTYILVWMVTAFGDTIGIPDTVMGLTLLAAGASTPDTMLSIIAARGGYGDMAISHSIGSNLFDILVGLGLPWFIQTVIIDHRSTVTVYSGAISYISMLLLLTVVIAVVLINVCRFRLGKTLGVFFIIFFVIFIMVSILFELNLIVPGLTLPPCN
ncbi:sodium/potassium/calcium exchanger 4 isoform X2 [Strongylocentrotus purpuratus]|uniref:Sodium/calcium exchanger membrane region domain-containing protein n=1 Tax=Strongylocentrotus purpuratus TaxID=7668 RepID=A0A7M7HM37_STRPU|nr:sodium/potassium/calcium exchanger 4 isoform X2 [Strongylocentrotus purpuratus]